MYLYVCACNVHAYMCGYVCVRECVRVMRASVSV